MRVACARRNDSQASSPLALGSSRATSRLIRPGTSDFEGTCIYNNPSGRVLAGASISNRFRKTKGAAKPMSTPILTVAPAGIWNLDPVHSRVDFEVSYLAGTFKGEFHEIGAELAVEGERASLEGTAKVASVDVRDENLSAHLQSPDFFDAERHPELRFAAEQIRLDGDGRLSVAGELTIKGVTKPVAVTGTVSAPIADPYGNERIGLSLSATIDRSEFGVDWNNPLPSGEPSLANEVTIFAELQFVKPGGYTSE